EIETNTNAVCKDKDGFLWFGTINGLIKFDPKFKMPKNELEPKTHIIKIKVARKDTFLSNNAVLPYELNHIAFHYTGISLTLPEKVSYQYKLEGLDEEWSPVTKERKADFTNLAPGAYTFKVKACNNAGVWNKEPTTFSFSITPPFWQTWWFYSLSVVSGFSFIMGFVKIRERNLKREKRILTERVKIRTREIEKQKDEIEIQKQEIEEKNKKLWNVNIAVNKEKEKVEEIKATLEEQNRHMTSSISYAKRIQTAIMFPKEKIYEQLPESFIFYQPKDIVSGDFYWFTDLTRITKSQRFSNSDAMIIAAVDCTGHGVPGAFMSMIGNDLLNQIVLEKGITKPSEILNNLHDGVQFALRQEGADVTAADGMDIALTSISLNGQKAAIEYAGAHRPLLITRNNNKTVDLEVIKGNNIGIGGIEEIKRDFTNHEIELKKGDTFYIFSDGYTDQFGGPKDKKFTSRRLREFLVNIFNKTMEDQNLQIENELMNWKGDNEQTDDLLVIGVRI
ncbi:MAG: SpoIIE family protein phosphatase, partial [Bacteroidia bacterium]|nr:SpoIIE family protein phosphatase [Bacteroidia bacterium]